MDDIYSYFRQSQACSRDKLWLFKPDQQIWTRGAKHFGCDHPTPLFWVGGGGGGGGDFYFYFFKMTFHLEVKVYPILSLLCYLPYIRFLWPM